MQAASSRWSLERPLPRELLGADQTLAMIDAAEGRVKLYPLEMATAMTALLRARGVNAMVAEAWELEGTACACRSLGHVRLLRGGGLRVDRCGRAVGRFSIRGEAARSSPSSVRVLRDTEVLAAALGTEAARIFARSGDGAKALPMIETALLLDPVSPVAPRGERDDSPRVRGRRSGGERIRSRGPAPTGRAPQAQHGAAPSRASELCSR